jgi:hypothetical protein
MRILNCHPEIRCVNEPFNPDNCCGRELILPDEAALDEQLRGLWVRFNGLKHVWHPSGWPFATHSGLNDRLLHSTRYSVILLTRRNILRRVVSSQLSEQTRIWQSDDEDEKRRLREFLYHPLDREWIRWHIENEGAEVARRKARLDETGATWMELAYEDLFEESLPREAQVARVDSIVRFLGHDPGALKAAVDTVHRLLDPARMRFNSPDVYSRIPEAEEIERCFGSSETGWLFR